MTDVVVIGAGIAGLMAARHLVSVGHDVVVVDKGRGVGGRMATRRIDDAVFDHGAQFFTAKQQGFAAQCTVWEAEGSITAWFTGSLQPDGSIGPDAHARFRGAPGMTAAAKSMAADLDVRTDHRVSALRAGRYAWQVELASGSTIETPAVVMTAPVPQALELLEVSATQLHPTDADALARVAYDPCIAALVACAAATDVPTPGALRPAGEPLEWVADNQQKGISPVPALTLHAGPTFSAAHWTDDDAAIVDALLDALSGIGVTRPEVVRSQVHRWRYSKPSVLHPEPYLLARDLPPLVFVGDAFHTARVEGAALSGVAGATALDAALA